MIPLSTTTITVYRPDTGADDYSTDDGPQVVGSEIRAHLSTPRGNDQIVGGEKQTVDLRLDCDPFDFKHYDVVKDDTTNKTYRLVWFEQRYGFGLDHVEGGLQLTTGTA